MNEIAAESMNHLVFEITQEVDGGFVADAMGESIVTQGDDWEELRNNVLEAVTAFYFDQAAPQQIHLRHFGKNSRAILRGETINGQATS